MDSALCCAVLCAAALPHTRPATLARRVVGEQAESYWLYNVPWSINRMLTYMKNRYDNPYIWVLENGISEKKEGDRQGEAALRDPLRTDYFRGYISEVCK